MITDGNGELYDRTAGSTSDQFWDDSAETLLKALIYYLLATRPEEEKEKSY